MDQSGCRSDVASRGSATGTEPARVDIMRRDSTGTKKDAGQERLSQQANTPPDLNAFTRQLTAGGDTGRKSPPPDPGESSNSKAVTEQAIDAPGQTEEMKKMLNERVNLWRDLVEQAGKEQAEAEKAEQKNAEAEKAEQKNAEAEKAAQKNAEAEKAAQKNQDSMMDELDAM